MEDYKGILHYGASENEIRVSTFSNGGYKLTFSQFEMGCIEKTLARKGLNLMGLEGTIIFDTGCLAITTDPEFGKYITPHFENFSTL